MQTVVPLLASLVALIFAFAVFDQYLAKRQPYQLLWTAGLLLWCLGTAAEFVVQAFWFNGVAFRLWYVAGAFLTAATLGEGTLYLLAPRWVARSFLVLLAAGAIVAISMMFSVDLNLGATYSPSNARAGQLVLQQGLPITGRSGVVPSVVGYLTIPFNVFGAGTIIGGALWSAAVFAFRRRHPRRALSNAVIAAGAMLLAIGGTSSDLGAATFRYLSELFGVVVMFSGFLISREVFDVYGLRFRRRSTAPHS